MLEVSNVTKKYDNNIGNFNINLKVSSGEVYGIVGPNGTGKTTLIRQILGYVISDSGFIKINGINVRNNSKKIMEFTGYVSGEISMYDNFTGMQYLQLVSKFKGCVDWDFVEKLIKHFDLDTKRKIKKMSKGMKQKIAIISATMNKPKFLVLDEPTSGLDPIMQRQFNDLIFKLKNDHKSTIIICSHIFEELSEVCDRVGFIKDGKLVKEFVLQKNNIKEIDNIFNELYIVKSEL